MRRGRGRRRHSRRDQSAAGERIDLGGVRVTVPDGDGLTLVSAPGAGGGQRWERLRLWGIDAPEFPDQPFGHEARERLIALVAAAGEVRRTGRRVELRVRPGITARIHRGLVGGLSNDRDKYGRAVVTLHDAAGLCINEALVEAGLAWRYFDDGAYERAQSAAQAAGVGVHTPGMDPVKPWDWRKRLAKERAKSDADREGRWWPWAVLAVVVLLLYAVVAGASAPTGEDAAVRSWAACDARAASLSRATAHAERMHSRLMVRFQFARVSCPDLPELEAAALLAEGIAEGMRVQLARCIVPDDYAEDTHDVAAGARTRAGGSGRLRAVLGKANPVSSPTMRLPAPAARGPASLPAVAPTVPLPVAFLT